MSERTWREAGGDMAKLQASRVFSAAKRQALSLRHRHGEAPRWPLADMRNAVAAYHAGAPWMTGTSRGVAEVAVAEAARLRAELGRVLVQREKWAENAEAHDDEQHAERERLTAEVERWRVKADDLRKLVSAKRIEVERTQRQLAEARAEALRLQRTVSQMLYDDERICERAVDHVCGECHGCLLREHDDALAREDGGE
jgi:hypothetical protein